MRVTITLQGQIREMGAGEAAGPIDVALPDGATVGDLLRHLAHRLGGRFRQAVEAADQGLPPTLRVFVDGELALNAGQVLSMGEASSPRVVVVIMAPMMGGVR